MRTQWIHGATYALALWAVLVSTAAAANFTVSGTVSGPSGALSGATVDALTPGTTTVIATATTNGSGAYSLSVGAGTYDIRVTPPSGSGLQTGTQTNVTETGDLT